MINIIFDNKKYYQEHKKEMDEYNKNWKKKNKEHNNKVQNEYSKKYYKKYPQKLCVRKWRNIILNTLGRKCSLCGSIERLEIHEKTINPTINDCIIVCRHCHMTKIHNLSMTNHR